MADQDHLLNGQAHRERDPRADIAGRFLKPLPQSSAEELVAPKLRPATSQQVGSEKVATVVAGHEHVSSLGQLAPDLDYTEVHGLSTEVVQKLSHYRPTSLGQAARISGVTPAAISLLRVHLKRRPVALRDSRRI